MYATVTRTVRERAEAGRFADPARMERFVADLRRPLPGRRSGVAGRSSGHGVLAAGLRDGGTVATDRPPTPPARRQRPHQPRSRRHGGRAGRRRARRLAGRLRRRQRRAGRAGRRMSGRARRGVAVAGLRRPRRGQHRRGDDQLQPPPCPRRGVVGRHPPGAAGAVSNWRPRSSGSIATPPSSGRLVAGPGVWPSTLLFVVRVRERAAPSTVIRLLASVPTPP